MKGKILKIGYIDENRMPQGWEFDCMDIVPAFAIKAGLRLYAGYTIQELENISLSF